MTFRKENAKVNHEGASSLQLVRQAGFSPYLDRLGRQSYHTFITTTKKLTKDGLTLLASFTVKVELSTPYKPQQHFVLLEQIFVMSGASVHPWSSAVLIWGKQPNLQHAGGQRKCSFTAWTTKRDWKTIFSGWINDVCTGLCWWTVLTHAQQVDTSGLELITGRRYQWLVRLHMDPEFKDLRGWGSNGSGHLISAWDSKSWASARLLLPRMNQSMAKGTDKG